MDESSQLEEVKQRLIDMGFTYPDPHNVRLRSAMNQARAAKVRMAIATPVPRKVPTVDPPWPIPPRTASSFTSLAGLAKSFLISGPDSESSSARTRKDGHDEDEEVEKSRVPVHSARG